jgi:transposase
VRTVWRLRDQHIQDGGRCIPPMQKARIAMNVQLHNASSDLSRQTGQAILGAILSGQRDPGKLAALRHWRIQAREEEIIHSLRGNWKQDVLFELQQAVDAYDFYRKPIAPCDRQLKPYRVERPTREALPTTPTASKPAAATDTGKKRRPRKPKGNPPDFARAEELERILGVNATLIDGIDGMTIPTVLAEVGPDRSACKTGSAMELLAELSAEAGHQRGQSHSS